MNTLYVKELSKLTKVSIRTLHYYDKIGLLKPSERLSNGYRVYSARDLQKLEKIIALKFLGFTLARIQQLIVDEQTTLEHLEHQLALMESDVSFLQDVQKPLLVALIQEYRSKKSINWHDIASLIVAYMKEREELQKKSPEHSEPSHREIWQKLTSHVPPFTQEKS